MSMIKSRETFEVNDTFIRTAVQKYMLPSVIALIGTCVTTVANSMIVGNYVGIDGLSALNISNPIYFAYAAVGALIHVGASTNASLCIGRNEPHKADSYATLALWLSLVFSALLTAAGLLCFPQLINALGTANHMRPYVSDYAKILLIGGGSISFMYYPFNFLKADGRPRQGTYMFMLMFIFDLVFCFLFVIKWNMGMRGAALSLVLSTFAGDIYGLCLLYNKQAVFTYGKIIDFGGSVVRIVNTGSSMALNNLCNILKTIALNHIILKALSEEGLTVFAVIGTVNSFSNAVISGIAQTITPLVGVFYGERDNISIKTVVKEAIKKGVGVVLVMTVLTCICSKWIGAAFAASEVVMLEPAVIMLSLSFLPAMFNNLYIFYYFTTEKIGLANALTLLRNFVFIIAFAMCFVYWKAPQFIWLSFMVSELATLAAILIIAGTKCIRNKYLRGLLMLDCRYEETDRYLAFSVENTKEEASGAAKKISDFCKEKKMSQRTTMTISLAVEEMLLIIFDHCLSDIGKQYADVRIVRVGEKIILYMRCAGKLFDPIAYYRKRKEEAGSEVLMDDSLGIEMIIKRASEVVFSRTFGVNNLTIVIYERMEENK
ncbi:MAG: hypothetical protein K2K46_09315 [Lachnospiraceae bacterium]|nr:hypothetical protein [Lachnospiraceae bacterium]